MLFNLVANRLEVYGRHLSHEVGIGCGEGVDPLDLGGSRSAFLKL
jgi:hypothetical protein